MIEVVFEDNSKKKFVITQETTVGELISKIILKLSIQKDAESFGLYDSQVEKSNQRIDRFLSRDVKVPTLFRGHQLLFKKRFFNEDNSSDLVTSHMEYIQLRAEVIKGYYSLTEHDFLQMAAFDLRILFGTPNASKHKEGFLLSSNQLVNLIPAPVYNLKKPLVWEKLILDEFQLLKLNPVKSESEAKICYIKKLKEITGDYYGSVFYDVVELSLVQNIVKGYQPAVLALNRKGIHTFWKNEKGQNLLSRTSAFEEIQNWGIDHPTHSFVYSVFGDSEEGIQYAYETTMYDEIPNLCQVLVEQIGQNFTIFPKKY